MKTIIITGGSDGLGKTLAKELSKDNKIIIIATNEKKLKETARETGCDYFVCDVRKYEEIKKIIDEIGNIDVLINNAGLRIQDELEFNDHKRIQEVIEVNILGVINCTKACIPTMKKKKEGLIININSQSGINHKAERVVYNASKRSITGFSRSLEDELKKYNIKVTDIMPGKMKTDMFKKMKIEKEMNDGLETKEVARLIKFIIETPKNTTIPEVGIKHINN